MMRSFLAGPTRAWAFFCFFETRALAQGVVTVEALDLEQVLDLQSTIPRIGGGVLQDLARARLRRPSPLTVAS